MEAVQDSAASFNPDMLVLAREAQGWTQSHLARLADITQGHLSKIESGLIRPTDVLVARLAELLHVPVRFLASDEPVYGPGASEFFHRKQQLSSRILSRIHAQLNIRRMHLARLLRAVDMESGNFPRIDPEEFNGDAAAIARAVRSAWQVPSGPVKNLVELVENAGGVVVLLDFGSPKLAGISRWVPGVPPMFFLNSEMPGDRQRLTLAHELGHVVMHSSPTPEMEDEAFAFGAEFLMPEQDIRRQFVKSVSLHSLASMKPIWKVSMAALLMRAGELGCVSERQKRYLWMRMGEAGYRRAEPPELDVASEAPSLLQEIIDVHLSDLGYSIDELARLLDCKPETLARDYGIQLTDLGQRPRLRMVPANG